MAPVVINGGEPETCAASTLSSSFYRDRVKVFRLTKTMRNRDDPQFSKMVDDLGDGVAPVDDDGFTTITGVQTVHDVDKAIEFVFPREVFTDPVACSKRSIISFHNDNVDDINAAVLSRFPGVSHTLEGRTMLDHEHLEGDTNDFFSMSEYLSLLRPSGVPSHTIKLKKGVVVMLCRNLSIDHRLSNGTKVVVEDIKPYTLQVRTLDTGTIHFIPRISFKFVTTQGVAVKRIQFPVRLCFACTCHRAQGMTLDRTALDFTRHPFTHGHCYVALSRTRCAADTLILTTPELIDDDGYAKVQNIVYSSLLPDMG